MSNRNDPDVLEAEAKQLLDKMMGVTPEPSAEDTQEEQTEVVQEAPESTDMAETIAEDTESDGSGEPEDLRSALQKAEKAMKGAQSRMTKATQETADLKRQNADLLAALAELKSESAESKRDSGKLDQLREDYPDLAAPLLDELARTQSQLEAQKEALAKQEQSKTIQSKAKQCRAKRSNAKQSSAKQSNKTQCKALRSNASAIQCKATLSNANQCFAW